MNWAVLFLRIFETNKLNLLTISEGWRLATVNWRLLSCFAFDNSTQLRCAHRAALPP